MHTPRLPHICLYLLCLWACNAPPDDTFVQAPNQPTPYQLVEPAHFVKMQIPADNPLTEAGVALGRFLFYDSILSADSTIACASCHLQSRAFTDAKDFSTGIHGQVSRRSAPSLLNVGYHQAGLFWDGRAASLEDQALFPVQDSLEMGNDWAKLVQRLQTHPTYPAYFRAAFGIQQPTEIDRQLVVKALAQFERTLISGQAKYDRVLAGEAEFTPAERRGKLIFFDAGEAEGLPISECGHCHIDPLFTNNLYFNNGIEAVTDLHQFPDPGRGAITGSVYDNGKFKVPTLRNITMTAPYMHDGRFQTLEEVLDHYRSGGHFADNVSPNVRQLKLNEQHKRDLIAFLQTLTDTQIVTNPRYANPFK